MSILLEFDGCPLDAKVMIEDDGKVAYAYILVHHQIVGDVWLYNVGKSPESPEWPDRDKMPYCNPVGFVSEEIILPIRDKDEVVVTWERGDIEAVIWIRGRVHAILRPGAKPGWCRLAVRSSPVARPLDGSLLVS